VTAPPFTVIGGYLGAGKTTLLNNLLTQAKGLRAAVVVNDFGDVNIDASLIAAHDGETISLANGCMCCSLSGGFASTIAAILARVDSLDAVIVEASGVAEPGKIAQYGQMFGLPLDGVLVVVDAEQVRTQATNKYVGDTVLRQLGQADLILLNKIDLAPDLPEVRTWLAERAPAAPICETTRCDIPLSILVGRNLGASTRMTASRFAADDPEHELQYRTWTIVPNAPVARATLERWASLMEDRIFRAKGFVRLAEEPSNRYLFQQVGRRWTLEGAGPWQNGEAATRIVCIGPRVDLAAAGRGPAFI
jgi:G3E family GTPase